MRFIWMFGLGLFLFSCENSPAVSDVKEVEKEGELVEVKHENRTNEAQVFETAQEFAKFCLSSIDNDNFERIAPYVADELVLSPNAYIDVKTVQKLDFKEVAKPTDKVYTWGVQPGSGNPIELTVPAYFDKFVRDIDINMDELEVTTYKDKPISRGSELHNMQDFFSGCEFVEFFKPPSEEGFIDWSALFLIVRHEDDGYKLVGLVHNLWTP